jgi:hypothetical protein
MFPIPHDRLGRARGLWMLLSLGVAPGLTRDRHPESRLFLFIGGWRGRWLTLLN